MNRIMMARYVWLPRWAVATAILQNKKGCGKTGGNPDRAREGLCSGAGRDRKDGRGAGDLSALCIFAVVVGQELCPL